MGLSPILIQGQSVLFASLNLHLCSHLARHAASQLPLSSFRAHSTCLPYSALCLPPPSPPSTPKSLPLGLALEDSSCLFSEPLLGGPRVPEAAADPSPRHTQWPGTHTSPSVCQVLIRPVGWV